MKTPLQNGFNPINLCSNIAWGNSSDLADGRGIHAFEIQQHQLPIEGFQAMYKLDEAIERHALISLRMIVLGRSGFEIGETGPW